VTRPGARGLAALVLAAVLGISGGVIAALRGPAEPQQKQARDPGVSETAVQPLTRKEDPLRLGVRREDLECDGRTYIFVGWGDGESALYSSVADWPGVRYLKTRQSCPAVYPTVRGGTPRYFAYLPGFDTPAEACKARMTAAHKGNYVTRMRAGLDSNVPCACVLDVATLPAIGEGQPLTTESGMWIYLYQRMLADLGLLSEDVLTGLFDRPTANATRRLQTDAALNPSGIVDPDTWNVLRSKYCNRYDF
jgi:peptidoglycan hydrolase-like protein with peptidoglycan-binding domain